jgi:predicted metal-dependent hydrolase
MGAPPTPFEPEQLSLFGESGATAPASRAGTAQGLALDTGRGSAQAGRPAGVPGEAPSTVPRIAPPLNASPEPATREFRHPRASRELLLQGCRVGFELRRARRRSIGFVIGPEGLAVSAPRWTGSAEIEAALREKAAWIVRKLHEQHERAQRLEQSRIAWGDGACVPFLGETVIVVLDPRTTGAVLHTDAEALPGVPRLTLHVGLPQGAAADQVREAVQGWLQRQARRIFEERCAHYALELGVQVRRLSLSSAATRWGSAGADGSVRLNWRLVHFARPVIDYVVAHELAHLRVMDHSPRFWEVVGSVVPDFQARRAVLQEALLPPMD